MINFCVEPKKPCRKNPIGELDFKIDKCYSSIYSRLCCHENDSVSHISQEERDEWNGKASNSALLDLQNQLNEVAGDGDNSIKKEILIEVSRQIAGAITDLNIEDYAKKKYVDDAISNIDFDQYITNTKADSTYLKKADYIKLDPTSYYTKAEVQKIIEDSTIGKDYPIQSFTIEDNKLLLTQKNGGQFKVYLSGIGSGVGVDTDYVQEQLSNYIKKNTLSKLVINDQTYSLESGRDIKIPTSGAGSSIDYTKFGYNKFYFKKHQSNSVAPSKPSANRPPEDGSGWVEDAPNQEAGYYIWMTQVFINGNGQYGEYTNPICLTGTAGESAVSYDIKTSTSTINYQDGTMYPKTISVYVVKSNGSQITNITPSNSSGWSFSYSVDGGDAWTAISSDQIQTEGDNGMLFRATNGTMILSEYVPIVRSGINGSTYSLQLSNISLSYVPADQNYNLQMSCNVNLYKNENTVDSTDANLYNLYMQVNSNDRTTLQYNTDHWDATVNTTVQSKSSTITIYAYNTNGAYLTSMTIPVSASGDASTGQTFKGSPWSAFSLSPNVVADLVVANKAFIKELSSNELVIFDDQKIVAGMTSSKAVDDSSPLNGKVTTEGKGDVRIWAGEISNADLTTAPFTVTNTGNLTAHTATLYDATFYATNANVKITNELFTGVGQATFNYERAGLYISGNSEEYGDSNMFFGMQSQYPLQIGGSVSKSTTPIMYISNKNNDITIHPDKLLMHGQGSTFETFGVSDLYGLTNIQKLGRFIRNDSLKANLDDQCSISINAGTFGSTDSSSYTITLPDSLKGRDIIIVNPKWNSLIIQAPEGYTLYKYGSSVSQVDMPKYTMAHAVQISDRAWIIGMMA